MAYDQSWRGVFPWTEDQPISPADDRTYGGFKAAAETSLLNRHAATGFPAVVARPAAIYGPDNNIFDMETPMFLRLQRQLPILVPHGGLVVGSYGHVDDLCDAMLVMATHPMAAGEVFNVTTSAVDVHRYIATLAEVVGNEPDLVAVPAELSAPLEVASPPVFGHLFKAAHHAMLDTGKAERLLGVRPRFDLRAGHADTYEWFLDQGWDRLDGPLADPVWKSSWDFAAEARWADRIRHG
jgi:nucleoside-diphosphate-sugar epimerase